jgi:hypothetical protein
MESPSTIRATPLTSAANDKVGKNMVNAARRFFCFILIAPTPLIE